MHFHFEFIMAWFLLTYLALFGKVGTTWPQMKLETNKRQKKKMFLAFQIWKFFEQLNISCKSVVIQGFSTKPQWSADGFFYQGTFSPSLTQQIGGEGTLDKLMWARTACNQLCRMQSRREYCTYKQVGGYEDSTGPRTELFHDHVSSLLLHVTMLKKGK